MSKSKSVLTVIFACVTTAALGQVKNDVQTPIASSLADHAAQIADIADGRGVLVLTVTASDTQADNWSVAGVVHDELVRLLADHSAKVLVSPKIDTLTANRRITAPLDEPDLDRIRSLAGAEFVAIAVYRHSGRERTVNLSLRSHADGKILWEGKAALDESQVKMADNIPGLNQKVVAFCLDHVGKQVGDGSAWALAAEALAAAGAKRTGVYVHGRKLGALDHPLPGDVVRIEDARFRGQGKWRTIGHGTAIVETVQSPTVFTAFHQKDKAITRTTFSLHEKRDGLVEIFRPRPKVLKAIEPSSGDDATDVAAPIEIPLAEGVMLTMRPIEAGRFRMGDASVTLTRPFHLGITEVTQDQWKAVIGKNPSESKGGDLPVTNVSWNDVQSFVEKLNQSPAGKSFHFRLPTSAEWEYACRAGTSTRYSFGDDALDLVEYAWFVDNSEGQLSPAAQLQPNKWGLFDMHGSVWEWTQDVHTADPLGKPAKDATDPRGPREGKSRTLRGGCYLSESGNLRSSNRGWLGAETNNSKTGFRIAAEPR